MVVIYFRFAGSGALMGDDEARRSAARVDAVAPPGTRGRRMAAPNAVVIYAALAVAYMLIPIAVIAVFSFNDPQGNFNSHLGGLHARLLEGPVRPAELTDAMVTSLELAALSTVIATAIGTLMALALVRGASSGAARRTC